MMEAKPRYNYIAALEDLAPPPAQVEMQHVAPHPVIETNLGFVLTVANLLITAIIITAMMLDGTQAMSAIIAGSIYFAVTMTGFSLVVTGALSAIVASTAHERTERQRIESYEVLGALAIEWRRDVERNRTIEMQAQAMPMQLTRRIAALETELLQRAIAVDPLHTPHTFVTAYSNVSTAAHSDMGPQVDTSAQEAVAWLSSLYNDLGGPDPKKLQLVGEPTSIGRLRVRMLGSNRGGGTREAGLFLLHNGAIKKVAGGYQLQLSAFPHRESLRNLL